MLTITPITRQYVTIDVAAALASGAPAVISGVDVALVQPRSAPVGTTAWVSAAYASGTATVLVAGYDADPTGALVIPGGRGVDLWIRVVDAPEVTATRVIRIMVEPGPDGAEAVVSTTPYVQTVAGLSGIVSGAALLAALGGLPGGGGSVSSVNTKTGAVVLSASDVGADASGAAATAQAFAVQRANHTGTQSADTLTDGSTNKAYTATERTKLSGVATGATAVTVAAAGTAGAALSATDATTTNARTPTAHASTHASAGSDPISIASTQVTGLGSAATQPTSAFDPAGAAAAVLPTQTGNSGKYLTTNGTAASWGTVAGGAGGLLETIRPPVGGAITPGHVASINSLGTLGNLVLGQMIVPPGTYDAAICRVATPSAGATVKIVAYAYDTTNTVGSLLFETASVAATSGGYLSVTLPAALVVSAAQVIWIGLVPQGSAASTFWATQQGIGLPRITGLGSSIDLGGLFPPSAITVTGVTAAAPTSPTITWTDNHNFRIALHRSA